MDGQLNRAIDGELRVRHVHRREIYWGHYDEVKKAIAFYDTKEPQKCEACARDILSDPRLARWPEVKAPSILAAVVQDITEARRYHDQAEALWAEARSRNAVGNDQEVDKSRDDVRRELDELKPQLS